MQEVGVRPNCKAGSLCYSSTDYRSAVMLIGRSVYAASVRIQEATTPAVVRHNLKR